jgi:hypothetical protein
MKGRTCGVASSVLIGPYGGTALEDTVPVRNGKRIKRYISGEGTFSRRHPSRHVQYPVEVPQLRKKFNYLVPSRSPWVRHRPSADGASAQLTHSQGLGGVPTIQALSPESQAHSLRCTARSGELGTNPGSTPRGLFAGRLRPQAQPNESGFSVPIVGWSTRGTAP